MAYYIGQMSGTSLDGIDSILMSIDGQEMQLLVSHHLDFPETLKHNILTLCQGTENELDACAKTSNALSELYAQGIQTLLKNSQITKEQITAIGCHGQTVRHMPPHYTVQLINGALLAELCDIDVVCDFRSRDMAAGGQGAPLVPAFHQALFQPFIQKSAAHDLFIVNIGGMANISHLNKEGNVRGHDTGPGNVLLDAWCLQHQNRPFDNNGQWAHGGHINNTLLKQLLDDPYFKLPAPKSTGREHFNLNWLMQFPLKGISPQDIQATLVELTVHSIAQEIELLANKGQVVVCGGGALNGYLMTRLQARLNNFEISSSDKIGFDAQWIEAMAFAWLAKQCIERLPGNVAQVTGAKGLRILGAIYPR